MLGEPVLSVAQYTVMSRHSDEVLYSAIAVGTNDLLYRFLATAELNESVAEGAPLSDQ